MKNNKISKQLEKYAVIMNDNFFITRYGLSYLEYYNMIIFFKTIIMIGDKNTISYSEYLLSIAKEQKKYNMETINQLEKYTENFEHLKKCNFEKFSEKEYNDSILYINNIIYNKEEYLLSIVAYAEYLQKFFNPSKLRKFKLKKIINQNE